MLNKFNYLEWYPYLTNICLNITDDCNLECKYCFVEQHPNYMTLETAIDAVEWLHKNLEIKRKNNWTNHLQKHGEKASINFFGGEPTLLWDKIIIPLTEYIENKYPNDFILGMTTNGTLLDESKIKFLKEHNFQLLLSIDGDKVTQDYNRPCKNHQNSSFDLITKNIPLLLENFPYLTFRATIYQDTVDQMFNNYIYAQSLGFKKIFFAPNEREKWTKENIDKLSIEIQKIFYYTLLNYNLQIKNNSILFESFFVFN